MKETKHVLHIWSEFVRNILEIQELGVAITFSNHRGPGDPRVNLQQVKGYAKPYQVDQVVEALRRLYEIQEIKKQSAAKSKGS